MPLIAISGDERPINILEKYYKKVDIAYNNVIFIL